MRKCLSCGVVFDSDGPWNRICHECKVAPGRTSVKYNAIVRPDVRDVDAAQADEEEEE